jgi:hypothetical protein
MAMSTTAQVSEIFRRVLVNPTGGIVGLVDDLLRGCPESGLQLDWQAGCCRVRSVGGDGKELLDVPLRKSVFRAILARVAVLCNERAPNSVSSYGGQGELSVDANPAAVFRVAFVNTPATQKLELRTAALSATETAPSREVTEASLDGLK